MGAQPTGKFSSLWEDKGHTEVLKEQDNERYSTMVHFRVLANESDGGEVLEAYRRERSLWVALVRAVL